MDVRGTTKDEIIEYLVDMLWDTGKVSSREDALRCVREREEKMSTGIQNGIAIPHGKTAAVDQLLACIALKKEGVDFDSLDGEPSRIFIMTLSPVDRSGPHIQFLSEVSQLLQDKEARKSLLAANTPREVLDIVTGGETDEED
jgi:PTS system nitrogen regulatory IIA component